MTPILFALALAAQPAPAPAAERPLPSDFPPPRELTAAHDIFYQEEDRQLRPAAHMEIHAFGRCAASNSPEIASRMLRQDFTSQAYRSSIRQLSRNNEGCFRRRGRMQFAPLLLAGAVAEAFLVRTETPLNVRLARAAAGPATPAFSPSDRVAICTVRSMPDQVAVLLAATPASADEEEAARALAPAVQLCAQGGPQVRATTPGLRAIIATAAFRTVTP